MVNDKRQVSLRMGKEELGYLKKIKLMLNCNISDAMRFCIDITKLYISYDFGSKEELSLKVDEFKERYGIP